jgi:hypothetical protein
MKSLFISLLLLFPLQITNKIIKIEGLEAKYHDNQNIEFSITNNDVKSQYYYIGMEYYEKNGWLELINDITRPTSKSSLVNVIKPAQKIKSSVPMKTILYLRNNFGFKKYRLKVVYGESVNKISKNYFSESFEFVQNPRGLVRE